MLFTDDEGVPEDRAELAARLTAARALSQFLLRAYNVLRHYGVNFMDLPEWNDTADLDKAARLKPSQGGPLTIQWLTRLEHALTAAIRRKSFRVVDRDPPPPQ